MTLEEKLTADLKTAMKSGDKAALRTIRSIKSAILLIHTDGSGDEITPDREVAVLSKLLKQRQDSLKIYEEQGRQDLATTEEEEIQVIMKYLPAQLSDGELIDQISAIVSQTGAISMKDMGKVMGIANKTLAGKAEGARIAAAVKQILS